MPYFVPIYGFELTRPIAVQGVQLYPRFSKSSDAHALATNTNRFNLTAVAELPQPAPDFLYDLFGAMTFCQQQWVPEAETFDMASGKGVADLLAAAHDPLPLPHQRPTQGAVIMGDSFAPAAREEYLNLCLSRLQNPDFEHATSFRTALFRSVESWRLLRPFVDVTYYLDFSALEILARRFTNDFDSPAALPMTQLLQHHGFDFDQDDRLKRHRAVQTYAHLRNALFHNGQFEAKFNENGQSVTLRLAEYEGYLRRLLPDVLLRVLGYDDGHINWNRWQDRQPFR